MGIRSGNIPPEPTAEVGFIEFDPADNVQSWTHEVKKGKIVLSAQPREPIKPLPIEDKLERVIRRLRELPQFRDL